MFRLSFDPSALSASAMLPPFRDTAPQGRGWNGTAALRDVASDRIAGLCDLRIVLATGTIGAHVLAGAERAIGASMGFSLWTVHAPTLEALVRLLADDRAACGTVAFLEPAILSNDDAVDVERLFDEYRHTITELAGRFPAVRLIAMTMPLAADAEVTIGRMIARSLGRDRAFEHNRCRNAFNRLLLDELTGRMPIFDLARLESTRPDGTRTFACDGADPVYSLTLDYTDSTGQLNETAERLLGEQLLVFLAGLPAVSRLAIGATW